MDLPTPTAERDIRVQITATTIAIIGAGMAGRLSSFPLKDGDRFKDGQLLARFDCAVQDGALARARAGYEKRRKIYEIQQKQRQLGSNSALDFEIASAELHEAGADVAAAQAVSSRCSISAPFAGRVAAVMARDYQYVGEGAPLLEILSDRDLEVEMMVPSRWLGWLKVGARFDVAVDETKQTYAATLIRVSGKVDAVSQSIKVYGRIPSGADTLLPGMSGRAQFHPPS
ncbi:efflux RND transporter periplasmic adaptor subunit [Magnetospirillum sulfuroxidans]|uniref:Efflux RND transporter periplasmic adaptor subunit n=1 Tax=Magnetospirillum sulfuroxidans TaxID=611300 RepID=A0ABS5I9K3_9PROT|nr:efflux RND transporter periplasmic adaptor subunit [Magnetospirillum sulfuroxidans]MBR9971092.1 efflux RND transporter periplasmic adaptor subunit [Magnetospirillum sulfuroxidans]